MPVFVGPNSPSPGTDFEAKSDRIEFPIDHQIHHQHLQVMFIIIHDNKPKFTMELNL